MALVKRLAGLFVILLLMSAGFGAGWLVGRLRLGSAVNPASLSQLERRFTDQMQGAALVGHFTVAGREDREARPDRYDIASVAKVGDDEWRFNARIRYGSVDATLPIVVTMRWAGDTPMVTITDFTIPEMGTFTARVFFYGDRYAGTWQHGAVGGHMFGRIEKSKPS
jgi:hypothetical protein